MPSVFGAKFVREIAGVSRMQLQHWDKMGIVRPSIKIGSGKGSRKEYSFRDLVQLKVSKRLRDEGTSLQKIRNAMRYLRKNFPDLNAQNEELLFLTNGDDIFVLAQDPKVILDVLKRQFVLCLALGDLITELKGCINNLEAQGEERVIAGQHVFTAILTPDMEDGGYTITCREMPEAISQGETRQEALDNIVDAIDLCMEAKAELGDKKIQAK